jgi:cytochrome c553/cytochrome c5
MKAERWLAAVCIIALVALALALQTGAVRLGHLAGPVLKLSASLDVPPLQDAAMIRRGAAHYERVCATCHASPLEPERGNQLTLSPPAPKLYKRLAHWSPEALFLIVRDGSPGSGMPAWPTNGREDEIWSVVAFLRALPELDPAQYRVLAGLTERPSGIASDGPLDLRQCQTCHGVDGRGDANGAFPRLDIQTPAYLGDALRAYRDGSRQSGFMAGVAARLSDGQIDALANHFGAATLPQIASRQGANPLSEPIPEQLAACAACHGPPAAARPDFPRLTGQYAPYLEQQLNLFTAEMPTRGGGRYHNLMLKAAHTVPEEDIPRLSAYYGQTPDQ